MKGISLLLVILIGYSGYSQTNHNTSVYIYNYDEYYQEYHKSGVHADIKFNDQYIASLNNQYRRLVFDLVSLGEININISVTRIRNSKKNHNQSIKLNVRDGGKYFIEIRYDENKIEIKEFSYSYGQKVFGKLEGTDIIKGAEQEFSPIIPNSVYSTERNRSVIEIENVGVKIPLNHLIKTNRFAIIIGNEEYSSRQTNLSVESNVPFAMNDATIFKEYCVKTLGLLENNVFLLTNATSAEIKREINRVTKLIERTKNPELLFYYAGHGHYDVNSRESLIIPIDVNSSDLSSAIYLSSLFKDLNKTKALRITVFIDACFSGGGRLSGLISARAVKVRPREELITNNMVVFAATSGDKTAFALDQARHGLFTYFILLKFQKTNGDVTYGELMDYLIEKVTDTSIRLKGQEQLPQVRYSSQIENEFRNWKFK